MYRRPESGDSFRRMVKGDGSDEKMNEANDQRLMDDDAEVE